MGSSHIQLNITGASCASCVNKVEMALKSVSGVEFAEMNFADRVVQISGTASVAQLIQAAGYQATELKRLTLKML